MSKSIAVSTVFSVIAHIGIGVALTALQKPNSTVLQVAPAQKTRVNVQLVQAPTPMPSISEEPQKHIVTTTAPSDFHKQTAHKKKVEKRTPPKPDKTLPTHAVKPAPPKAPSREGESKPSPKVITKNVSSEAVESKVEEAPVQGASSEYRRIDKPQLAGRQVQPAYPYRARKLHHQGTVILDIKLDEKGKIVTLEVEKTSGYRSLDKAAVSAVGRWRFQPLIENGHGVRSRVRVPVRFRLG
ncbi:energy transducer TonB [Sansalvadorimonas verongulae]|uniref:energy transducer TonB n=1 Tax=Sansalvadorimonas verongulae TaxID=2172824 RepID=UPI0018AD1FCE|nr:energy transducer TonB [Sansalvadorimonas verongulae]